MNYEKQNGDACERGYSSGLKKDLGSRLLNPVKNPLLPERSEFKGFRDFTNGSLSLSKPSE